MQLLKHHQKPGHAVKEKKAEKHTIKEHERKDKCHPPPH